MCWFLSVLGICAGNNLWLMGMVVVGIGIWGVKVKKESVEKMVRMMSMTTGGKPKGFALKVKNLIEPVDRTNQFGYRMLILGITLIVVGCSLIAKCA